MRKWMFGALENDTALCKNPCIHAKWKDMKS